VDNLLGELIGAGREKVDRSTVACVLAVARFCAVRSELGIAEEWHEKAARGYSRYQHGDCKQACIGLVCTPEGLRPSYRVFAGNRADGATVEGIVKILGGKYGAARRVWVMDRGMVGEGLEAPPGRPSRRAGERKICPVRSTARAEKEKAMLARQSHKLASGIAKIHTWLKRPPKNDKEHQAGVRTGRVTGKYAAATKILTAKVRRNATVLASGLDFWSDLDAGQKANKNKGAYLLRTNRHETDPALIWRWYIQPFAAEAAFRKAKSDPGLRSVCHQAESRVEADILVCFLAPAPWPSAAAPSPSFPKTVRPRRPAATSCTC